MTTYAKDIARRLLAMLTCMALVLWCVMPSSNHTPDVFATIQDHLEMIADHGHSHGVEEDLFWAMHGHSHDVADHDHSQAFLMSGPETEPAAAFSDPWLRMSSTSGPTRQFRIDRPPRA